jgi:hypothetical protein
MSADPELVSNLLNCEGSAGEGEKSLGGRRGSGKELLALSAGTASTPAKARWDFTPFCPGLRIRIFLMSGSWIRIRISVKSWIRIRI